jgi:hypothetical protein
MISIILDGSIPYILANNKLFVYILYRPFGSLSPSLIIILKIEQKSTPKR